MTAAHWLAIVAALATLLLLAAVWASLVAASRDDDAAGRDER